MDRRLRHDGPPDSGSFLAGASRAGAVAGSGPHAMIIDAHFHSWQLARGDYGWLTPAMGSIYRDVEIADWLAQARPCGVVGGVLVQAAPTEAETKYLLDLAQRHPEVLGVVGWVDLLASDAPQRIAALARNPKLRGLRPM